MALTRDFKATIQARVARDPVFREALLNEGAECLLSGDVDTGKSVLRDDINATIQFAIHRARRYRIHDTGKLHQGAVALPPEEMRVL